MGKGQGLAILAALCWNGAYVEIAQRTNIGLSPVTGLVLLVN